MTKVNNNLPFVSICTPTFNRRPFIPFLKTCFLNQTYPLDRMEWIIVDDGSDCIEDLMKDIKQIKYYYFSEKMTLGKKRNLMHSFCKGDIIIYMDDDDYYPPERVSHAVETLLNNPSYLIAGSSILHIYFNDLNKIYQCGPYGKYHSTAATFAFRKELLNDTTYNDEKALAEETYFLKNYTIPLIQLNPLKTILVFSHSHNSYDKKKLLENPSESKITECSHKISDFIKNNSLKQFYTKDMHILLDMYPEGNINLKPDVIKQITEIQENRNQRKAIFLQEKEAEKKIINSVKHNNKPVFNTIEHAVNHYEKIIEDKSYLINELLKKIKLLTSELDSLKTS
jgi:glycosyltransferase involved in cell wall biosynthesis